MTDVRYQKALSPESSCHTGETVELRTSHLSWSRSQPLTAIQAKQLGSALRFWHNYIKANNNQWLGFICLETSKVWVFQTSASTNWAFTGVSPAASQTNKMYTASKLFHTVKITSVLTAHRPSESCASAWTRIKRFPSNKEMNGTRPDCQESSACWNLSAVPGERGNSNWAVPESLT